MGLEIEKNGKYYIVTETDGGWTLKDSSDDKAPTLKVSKGYCRTWDDLCKFVEKSSLY